MLAQGTNVDDVMQLTGLARSTVFGYLVEYVQLERPASIAPWVDSSAYREVVQVAAETGSGFLKPIHEKLEGRIGYEQIRVVLAHHKYAGA